MREPRRASWFLTANAMARGLQVFARLRGMHVRATLLCIFCSTTLAALDTSHAAQQYEAHAVKAAFLHRFAAYVEWPSDALAGNGPFTIAVLNDDAIVRQLEQLLPGLRIHGHRAEVRSISHIREAEDAHILYISPSQAPRTRALANAVAGHPVLVVTDQDDGLASGGIINFVQVGRNIRFEVSLPAARRNGLQINSGLLSVALRVKQDARRAIDGTAGGALLGHESPVVAHWMASLAR